MKISAIIAEYNPFHKGHSYLIEEARKNGSTHIVAIMSGNFVQRGECAVFSKWDRARDAVLNGVDLVLEMPTVWSISSAPNFALAGVTIAESLGCIDELVFGSESADNDKLMKLADFLADKRLSEKINSVLSEGVSYPVAREKAVEEMFGGEYSSLLNKPNDILAIEYISALKKLSSEIIPVSFKRIGAAHDSMSENEESVSASYIRQKIRNGEICTDKQIYDMKYLERAILMKLRTMKSEDFLEIYDVSEGLENRIVKAANETVSLDELYGMIKTKRYTLSRIRRIIMFAVLGIKKEDVISSVPYIKVLAANERGREVLKKAGDTSALPVIMKSSDVKKLGADAKRIYSLEINATDIFSLSSETILPCGAEQINSSLML